MIDAWYLLRTGPGAPAWNMAVDEALFENAGAAGSPVLRLYSWREAAATFGYFQKYSEVSSWTRLRPLIRRPTGGGLVPHDADWTYSLVFPPAHPWSSLRAGESYRQLHDWVSESLRGLNLQSNLADASLKPVLGRCFIGAEKHDVVVDGRKIAGAAQKRNKLGLLIQGSIQPPVGSERIRWEKSLLRSATDKFGVAWTERELTSALASRADELATQKYSTPEYNRRR